MKNQILRFLKYLWVLSILIFLSFFIIDNYEKILKIIKEINIYYILSAFTAILIAKILLSASMYYIIKSIGKHLSFVKCLHIYNISQLGKYIPGNIWHFVGKAAAYSKEGFSAKNIKDALIIENLWLVSSAFFYGISLLFILEYRFIKNLISNNIALIAFIILLAIFGYIISTRILKIDLWNILKNKETSIKIILISFFVWTFLGFGFAILIISYRLDLLYLSIALYAFAYSMGFITPFAPAGIGIREGVLALALSQYLSIEIIIIVSAANRLIYFFAEIILAVLSQILRTYFSKTD